jgi:biopolymer transport protein ExbD
VTEYRPFAVDLPARRRRAVLSLVPLIDVTFILLIFFMLALQLARSTTGGVTFSSAKFNALSEPAADTASGARPLTLLLGADGGIALWDGRRIGIAELSAALQERVTSIVVAGGATPPIIITPEPEVRLQAIVEVMRIAQANTFFETHVIVPKRAGEAAGK